MKIAIGFVLALAIGVLCRVASVPLPAPPVVIGALLVVAMTVGYVLADRFAQHRQPRHRSSCGGPLGYSASDARNVT